MKSLEFGHTYKNTNMNQENFKRKEWLHQLIDIEGIIEVEKNHYFGTTVQTIDSE